jgi:hypothetical protein
MQRESAEIQSAQDDPWRWKLRLFVSTDLVGSTAFKASSAQKSWAPTFKEFFRDFPPTLNAGYDLIPSQFKQPAGRLATWKFSGDEILFWVELSCHEEVSSHLFVVKNAIREFPKLWADKAPLRLKATAWLAGFPVTNTEIQIPTGESAVLDFIGPSIDLGFRIAKFCDDRRFVVSADLALMLLDGVDKREVERSLFHLHLHGLEVLKGVNANNPYPVFWIDMLDGAIVPEEQLLGIRREFHSDTTKDYLRTFIDRMSSLRRPFIEGDSDERYGTPDAELTDIRDEMRAEESNRNYLCGGEEDSPTTNEARAPKEPNESLRRSIDDVIPGVI